MSDPIASLRSLHEEATGDEDGARWHAYFGMHGDPSIVTDPARPAFTCVATVDKGPEDYGRARARLIAAMHANLPALLDAAELLRTIRGVAFAAEIDAVLSRLHVEDTP